MCLHTHTPQPHLQTQPCHNGDHIFLSYAQVMSGPSLILKAVSEGHW